MSLSECSAITQQSVTCVTLQPLPWFKSPLGHLLAGGSLADYLTPLSLSVFICKTGVVIIVSIS